MIDRESALALFRNACGLSVPLALECKTANGSATASVTHAFDSPFVSIGRDRKSDLLLDHAEISRRQAFLQAVAGRILVVDLESRTKDSWEWEEAPRSKGWLDQDRFIQVGPYLIRRVGSSPSEEKPRDLPDLSSSLQQVSSDACNISPAAALEVAHPDRRRPLAVAPGRAGGPGRSLCRLRARLERRKRSHDSMQAARVQRRREFGWLEICWPGEGVHINGERVRWAWLADGDSLRIGSFTFNLRYETPPDQISRSDVPLKAGASAPCSLAPSSRYASHLKVTGVRSPCVPAANRRLGCRQRGCRSPSSRPRSFHLVQEPGIRPILSAQVQWRCGSNRCS